MRIALAQLTATNSLSSNLEKMESMVQKAAQQDAQLLAFPELGYFMGSHREAIPVAEQYDALVKKFSAWAKHYKIELIPGTLREPTRSSRFYNTLIHFDSEGNVIQYYRKLFLFQANLPDRPYDENKYYQPGNEIAVSKRPWGSVGYGICFDLRFPELFRSLKKRGAQLLILPAAFTVPSGKAHWHCLLKTRAIENVCFVAAPALVGQCGDRRVTYGHSTILSPWGDTLGALQEQEDLLFQDLDMSLIEASSQQIDVWKCRRDDLFPHA